ncbi:3-isopropylmalate dehydratase large subunit [candidate division TA06 bacterium]|nr:3-isopropylmalate dehydratase large subunit [candidate division TA06 bacterium]
MGMTLTEKILAGRSNQKSVKAGDLIFVKPDLMMATDISSPLTIKVFKEMGAERISDPSKVALVHDHLIPAKDIKSADLSKTMRLFAREQGIKHYFEVGRSGIAHVLLQEEGLTLPGDVIIGADSHSCTYGAMGCFATGVGGTDLAAAWALGEIWLRIPESIKIVYKGKLSEWVVAKDLILLFIRDIGVDGAVYKALEFGGETVENLSMQSRFTLTNMAIEAGAKNGVIKADDTTVEYLKGRTERTDFILYEPDSNAEYIRTFEYEVSDLEPQVAIPFLPSNVFPLSEVEKVKVDQVYIGSCTNGRIEDFRLAAKVMKGKKIHDELRMIIAPGSDNVFQQLLVEGLALQFKEAGAVIGSTTCGACYGGHMGVMGENEVGVFTTNRNFVGRTGHPTARIYLTNPAVAAATAVMGRLADPREVV